jgi:SAM-dependent methyltransferase
MLLTINNDLSKMTVFAEGLEQQTILGAEKIVAEPIKVASFDNPVLLTDTKRIGELSSSLRDTVFSLYQSYPRVVSYDGVAVSWSPFVFPRVWCPSIDTIFFACTLKRYLKGVRDVAEIGCGSGYLIKYAIHYGSQIERAVATDINIEAIRCAEIAVADEPKKSVVSFVLPDADSSSLGLNGKFDLLIVNPPYVPRPKEKHNNPYEGRELIYKISNELTTLLKLGGHLLINMSSLSGQKPIEWFKEKGWRVDLIDALRVPLKVNPISNNISQESREWLKYLKSFGSLEEDEQEESGYRFWHELRLYDVHK